MYDNKHSVGSLLGQRITNLKYGIVPYYTERILYYIILYLILK